MTAAVGIQVSVKTFGLCGGDSVARRTPAFLPQGATVGNLVDRLRSQAAPTERLAAVPPDALLILINGRPIQYLGGWSTRLADGDEIAMLLKTAGG
jgi:molybdopterin converting factor small subunit